MIEGIRRLGSGVADAAVDFIVPRQCPNYSAFMQRTGLYPTCLTKARFVVPVFCARCSLPFDYGSGADSWRGACLFLSPPFERA
jgi:hypothetical protein